MAANTLKKLHQQSMRRFEHFIDVAHHEAYEILAENRDVLDALVVELA
jgi:ATP-dependent Zn protease